MVRHESLEARPLLLPPPPLLRSLAGCHLAHAPRLPLLVQCRTLQALLEGPSYSRRDTGGPGFVQSVKELHKRTACIMSEVQATLPQMLGLKRHQRIAQ